jgi:hypothetical protein
VALLIDKIVGMCDREMSAERNSSNSLFCALLAVLGFIVVFFATDKFGPGVSPDSINYVAAARSLSSGRGFLQYDGSPFTHWPPLFPTILATSVFLGQDVLSFVRFFNALIFGLTIFCFGRLVSCLIDARALRGMTIATALLSFPLLKMFVMVWSEPFFILLVLVFLERLARMHATKSHSMGAVLLLAGLAACACLQRYLGIVLVLCGAASLLRSQGVGWRQKLISVGSFCFLALLPLTLWVVRNQTLVGEAIGKRAPATRTVLMSLQDLLIVSTNWFVPFDSEASFRLLSFCAVTGFILVFAFLSPDRWQADKVAVRNGLVFAGATFLLAYAVLLVVIVNTVEVEPISQRYLTPALPIFLLFGFKAIEGFARWCETKGVLNGRSVIVSLGVGILILCQSAVTAFQVVSIWRDVGVGDYTHISWERSELLKLLARRPLDGQVYSNAADLIYLKTGIVALPLPPRGIDLAAWRRKLPANVRIYGAWFGQSFRTHLSTPLDLSYRFHLDLLNVWANEVLFELH